MRSNSSVTWKGFVSNTPFDYTFLDNEFDALSRSEKRMGTVFSIFTFLSIFVACLGLFGLATYMAHNRIKEIGVRKVLGASVTSVTTLLSKDFLILVMIAFVLAIPMAWWAMHSWPQGYPYRVPISIWVFVIAAFVTVFISLATVSFQAIKAALTNPVKSLRTND